jgi:glutathione S-transferase
MLKLVIANKLYSSWSLRPWLVLRAFAIPFEEVVIPLRQADSKARVLEVSPSGKVPALIDGDQTIWESMAIIEYIAESYPGLAIWPKERKARAHARSISNEMHSGFQPLRQGCPMDASARYKTPEITDAMRANIDRIETIWAEAQAKFGGAGPYLYGAFSAADAMYAPIAFRLDGYSIPVSTAARRYIDTILRHPGVAQWRAAALKEPWTIPDYAAGHTAIETFR